MVRLSIAAFVFGVAAALAAGQTSYRVITRPKMPTQEAMERLNLGMGWHARLPMESERDHLVSVQAIPRGYGAAVRMEVVAQTASGQTFLFDGETGALRWSTPVGIRYSPISAAAYNNQSIILTRRDFLFVLNRDTGTQRVYTKSDVGERVFGVTLDGIPSAAPTANDQIVVIPYLDRLVAYGLPDFERIAVAREKEPEILAQERTGSVQPWLAWTYLDPTMKLRTPATITPLQVSLTTSDGRVISLRPYGAEERLRFEFRTSRGLSAAIGSAGDFGYVGANDYNLYAIDLERDRLIWRFPSGAAISTRPEVNDADVFVVSDGRGLFRVHRFTGASYWLEPTAEKFLAAHYNKDAKEKFSVDPRGRVLARYVYAVDRQGKLLVIDGDRGGVLGRYDTADWQIPVQNEWSDRLYLANSDGQILCFRPRDGRRPQINKSLPEPVGAAPRPASPAPPVPPPPPPKEMEKKEMEKKEMEKKADDVMGSIAPPGRLPHFAALERPDSRFAQWLDPERRRLATPNAPSSGLRV